MISRAQLNGWMVFIFLFVTIVGRGQVIVKDTLPPSFQWILPLLDYPFLKDAAQAEANRRTDGTGEDQSDRILRDYGTVYRNLSMNQNTEMARNLHGTLYYGHKCCGIAC